MNPIFRFLIAAVVLFVLDVQPGMAELSEGQVKSAYVFNFVKFVEWPTGIASSNKVTICVVGNNVLGGALTELEGRKAGNHELHVAQYSSDVFIAGHSNSHSDQDFKELDDATSRLAGHANARSEPGSCQVVFIGESEQRHFLAIIKALGDSPALTISDIENFAEKGGCIGLAYRENKIVFEVNLASVQRAKLHLPGQLLNLASYVFGR